MRDSEFFLEIFITLFHFIAQHTIRTSITYVHVFEKLTLTNT